MSIVGKRLRAPSVTRWRLQTMTVAIALGALAVSFLAFFLARQSVRNDDQLLLRQETSQGSLVLGTLMSSFQPDVASVEVAAGPGGVDAAAWQAAATQAATKAGDSALALLRASGGHLQVLASVGNLHTAFGGAGDGAITAAVEQHHLPYVTATSAGGSRWLIQLSSLPAMPAGYALYSEATLPATPVSLNSLPGHPFAGLQGAVYAGRETPQDLVFTTTTHLPLTGERAVAVIPEGADYESSPAVLSTKVASISAPGHLFVVMRATANLTGAASARMPWILLGVLLAASVVTAALFEVSGLRRRRALAMARELEERNEMLDQAVAEQHRSDARFAAMVRSSSDLTTVVTSDGTVVYQSPSCDRLLEMAPEAVVGRNFSELLHPADLVLWQRALAYVNQGHKAERAAEWRLRGAGGALVPVETRLTNLLDDPAVAGIVLNSRDVSERTRLEEELRHQAFHDSLTGLANRALFLDRVEHAVARLGRSPGSLGVLFLDLDDFKAVNDRRGHGAGDDVLRWTSQRLRDTVRAGDTLARLGGDEFAVLVESAEPGAVVATGERILEVLGQPLSDRGAENGIRASIGVVTTSDPEVTPEELLREADIAMYSAKSAGKARCVVFDPGLHDRVIERLQLEHDMARAVENDQLAVVYQPIVDLETGHVEGVEALMRWHHPQRGIVMPGEFIPVAESTGLIVPMGRWLLGRACRDVGGVQETTARPDLHLAVNLSARQLDDPELVEDVSAALRSSGLAPQTLTLEITESVYMANPDRSVVILQQLKALGLKLSIDDFGTGYSSLAYLRRLPVDELKIDRAFVAADPQSSDQSILVEAIVAMADNFGLDTVAEGIETEEERRRLCEAGCHLAQGFLFARPAELAQVQHLVTDSAPAEPAPETVGQAQAVPVGRRGRGVKVG